jgi:hypothetical protein
MSTKQVEIVLPDLSHPTGVRSAAADQSQILMVPDRPTSAIGMERFRPSALFRMNARCRTSGHVGGPDQ